VSHPALEIDPDATRLDMTVRPHALLDDSSTTLQVSQLVLAIRSFVCWASAAWERVRHLAGEEQLLLEAPLHAWLDRTRFHETRR
jgi:hypothetical protein